MISNLGEELLADRPTP